MLIVSFRLDGLGLIVGCVMTLRPLFRRVLNLGGDTSNKRSGISSGRYGFGGSERRPYQRCETDYELRMRGHETDDRPSTTGATFTQVLGGKREADLSSFETESQNKILKSDDEASGDNPHSIVVTKHVKLSHELQ
jgi:hypothetical protein